MPLVLDTPFYRDVDPSKSSISHKTCSRCARWIIEVVANITSGACRSSQCVIDTHNSQTVTNSSFVVTLTAECL